MVQGIIQQVTKNAREYLLYRIADRRKTANMLWQDEKANKLQCAMADELEKVLAEYDKAEQELIEKINILHEESLDVSETYSLGHMHFYHKLIGDNQE